MFQKEYNPPNNMDVAIYDVRIWYKDHITAKDHESIGGYRASKYRFEILPERRKERVEGFGFNVYTDIDGWLNIIDMDNGAVYVVDMRDVLTFQTRTCKRVLPEERGPKQDEDKATQYCANDVLVTEKLIKEETNET